MKVRFFIPSLLLITACTGINTPMTAVQKEEVKSEATVVVKELFDNLTTNKYGNFLSMMDTTSEFVFFITGSVFEYDDFIIMASKAFPNIERQTFEIKFEKYIVNSPFCFEYFWEGKNCVYFKSGQVNVFEDYLGSYTFRKEKNKWHIVAGQESVMPENPSNPAEAAEQ
ncbi:MAG TPA: hypothetical protein PKH02_07330 [Bacteroidales bacterium]|nr:hypothetical protein [Bacteroidales bacterium]